MIKLNCWCVAPFKGLTVGLFDNDFVRLIQLFTGVHTLAEFGNDVEANDKRFLNRNCYAALLYNKVNSLKVQEPAQRMNRSITVGRFKTVPKAVEKTL